MQPISVELDGIIVEITNIAQSPEGKLQIEFQTDEPLTEDQASFVRVKMTELLNEASQKDTEND